MSGSIACSLWGVEKIYGETMRKTQQLVNTERRGFRKPLWNVWNKVDNARIKTNHTPYWEEIFVER